MLVPRICKRDKCYKTEKAKENLSNICKNRIRYKESLLSYRYFLKCLYPVFKLRCESLLGSSATSTDAGVLEIGRVALSSHLCARKHQKKKKEYKIFRSPDGGTQAGNKNWQIRQNWLS